MGENVLKFGTYVRVGNAAEAYELLQKNRNNKIVGGGIWMRLGSRRVATAIDLSACGLDQIEETETEFRIGAMCTLRQLERHAGLNALVNNVFEFAVHDIVGVQLRNTATVGGSIYGRFGFSDVLSAFLALDSYVELTGAGRVPLAEFVDMGYVRDVIEHVVVVKHDYRASYEAVRKAATDFPSLNVTAAWWDGSWHVTVGARPLRATLLQGEACWPHQRAAFRGRASRPCRIRACPELRHQPVGLGRLPPPHLGPARHPGRAPRRRHRAFCRACPRARDRAGPQVCHGRVFLPPRARRRF